MRNLVTEEAYLPIAGVNPDGNGISILPTEAAWIENLRPFMKGVRTREGTRGLYSFVAPPPFNHFHYLAHAQIATPKLFGFSDRCIWEYVSSDEYPYWKPVGVANSYSNIFDGGATNVSYTKTSDAIQIGFYGEVTDTEWGIYSNATTGLFPLDAGISYSSGDLLLFYLPGVTNVIATLDDASNTPLTNDGVWWYLEVPAGRTISSLSCDEDEFPRGIVWVIEDMHFDCSHFSSTEVYDNDGVKLVVAGSNPPEHGVAESDEGERVLLEYKSGTWGVKSLSQQLAVGRENTGIDAGSGVISDATIPNEMTAGDVLIPGQFTIFSLENGEVGRAVSEVDTGKYALYSIDGYLVEGSDSWVGTDGKWSIEFSGPGQTKFGTEDLYISYAFETLVSIFPRHVSTFAGRLVLGGTYEDGKYFPWRVRTCYVGDSDLFLQSSYSDLLDYGLETIEHFSSLGNSIFCYTREGLYRGFTDEGGNILFNSFWKGGTISGKTVSRYNNNQFFIGNNDIYIFDGSMVRSITEREGMTRVKETIFDGIDEGGYTKCFSLYYEREKEAWFFIKGAEDYPTRAWVYSLERRIWTLFTFSEVRCAGAYREDAFTIWNDAVGTWDEAQLTWNEMGKSSSNFSQILGMTSGPAIIDPQSSKDRGMLHEFEGPYATEAEAIKTALIEGPNFPKEAVTVSGAGSPVVNGLYLPDGFFVLQKFKLVGGVSDEDAIKFRVGTWEMLSGGDWMYYGLIDGSRPEDAKWETSYDPFSGIATSEGLPPPPTVKLATTEELLAEKDAVYDAFYDEAPTSSMLSVLGAGGRTIESNGLWWIVNEIPATPISWFLISRDFIYGSLERKDRTLLMDFEALGDETTIGVDGDFSVLPLNFLQKYSIPLTSSFSKYPYHPDFYDYAIRYCFEGGGFFILRWMQTKAQVYQHKGE